MRPWGSAQSPDPVRIGCYFPTARADLKGARQWHLPQFREINSPPHLDSTQSPQLTWDSLQWTGPTAMPWASLLINTRIFCFLKYNATASPVWHHRNTTEPVHFIFQTHPFLQLTYCNLCAFVNSNTTGKTPTRDLEWGVPNESCWAGSVNEIDTGLLPLFYS